MVLLQELLHVVSSMKIFLVPVQEKINLFNVKGKTVGKRGIDYSFESKTYSGSIKKPQNHSGKLIFYIYVFHLYYLLVYVTYYYHYLLNTF